MRQHVRVGLEEKRDESKVAPLHARVDRMKPYMRLAADAAKASPAIKDRVQMGQFHHWLGLAANGKTSTPAAVSRQVETAQRQRDQLVPAASLEEHRHPLAAQTLHDAFVSQINGGGITHDHRAARKDDGGAHGRWRLRHP